MPRPQITARAQEIIAEDSNELGEQVWSEIETIYELRHSKRLDDWEDLTIEGLFRRVAERMAEGEEE